MKRTSREQISTDRVNPTNLTPANNLMKERSQPKELKARIDWGEPALTIIGVRSLEAFNAGHIVGAIFVPVGRVLEVARQNLEFVRDIYLYGETEATTAGAAAQLREAGYKSVSELVGGLQAWQAAGYPVEGTSAAAG